MQADPLGITILVGTLIVLLVIRVPAVFALGISAVLTAWYLGFPLTIVIQRMVQGFDSYLFMAIPFLILIGQLLETGRMSQRMSDMANAFLGRFRGGLTMANILASTLCGGISGSSVTDTSSIGSILIPKMKKAGYDTNYSIAVTMTSPVQRKIIPSSYVMVLYAWVAQVSIGKFFLAGVFPTLFLSLTLVIVCYYLAVKRNYPKELPIGFREGVVNGVYGIIGLTTVLIIIAGIILGIVTTTESIAIAVIYAFFVTWLLYRAITWKNLQTILYEWLKAFALLAALIATSGAYVFMMVSLNIPRIVTETLLNLTNSDSLIFFIVIVLLLFLGMFMETVPLILLTAPILLPVVRNVGMEPQHFGIVMLLSFGIGSLIPPFGSTLVAGCAIKKIRVKDMVKTFLPFYITMFITLLFITYIPQISVWLPNFIFEYKKSVMTQIIIHSIIIGPIGIVIGSLVGAFFLKILAKIVAKIRLPYNEALWITFVVLLISNIISFLIGLAIIFGGGAPVSLMILQGIVGFIIGSLLYGKLIKHPDSGEIGIGKGVLISLILILIYIVLSVGLFFIITGIMIAFS